MHGLVVGFRFCCVTAGLLSVGLPSQVFVDVTASSGMQFVPPAPAAYGSGLCCADFDGDGDLDIVVPGVTSAPIYYFRNDGGLTFSDQTSSSGLPTVTAARGTVAADVDNDGDQDLLIANASSRIQLFINDGSATFQEEAIVRGLGSQTWAHGASFGDYDRDGWLDLSIANHGQDNLLYRNLGGGYFQDVTASAGVGNPGLTFSAPFIDYDQDGWLDIFCANDRGPYVLPNTILHNNRDGTFSDLGVQLNASQAMDGMGVDFVDAFNDGGVDIYCTDSPVDHLFLHWDPNAGMYVDDSYTYGLAGGGFAWATNWLDFDNDGWQDLHVVQTNTPNLLFHNPGAPAAAGTSWPEVGFAGGLAVFFDQVSGLVADLDDDGGVDVVNRYAVTPPGFSGITVHHNQTPGGNWLKLKTRGVISNRDGIGSRVDVLAGGQTQQQYVRSGIGYLSGSDMRLHFGLGAASQADRVTVYWPSGQVQVLDNVAANQVLEVVEPSFLLSGTVSPGGSATLQLSVQGDEGLLYGMVLSMSQAPQSQLPDGRFLPLMLDFLSSYTLIPGNAMLSNPLNYLDGFGQATSLLSTPNQPGLVGLPLYATAATVPPQGLPAIRTIFPEPVRFVVQ